MSQPLIANIQGLKELEEGQEVDREASPPILNIEENDQQDNLQEVSRELGNPLDSSSLEGLVKEEGANQGYESSSEESVKGMDCSEGATPFDIQKSTLRWVLALARPYMPLMLHIRASGEGPQATDTLYQEVLGLMQEKVPNTLQSIHLHCFNGDLVTVKLWSDTYPGTYFGFSSMVKGFGDRQRQGLKAVPGNRLLLESDSPHLPDVADL